MNCVTTSTPGEELSDFLQGAHSLSREQFLKTESLLHTLMQSEKVICTAFITWISIPHSYPTNPNNMETSGDIITMASFLLVLSTQSES